MHTIDNTTLRRLFLKDIQLFLKEDRLREKFYTWIVLRKLFFIKYLLDNDLFIEYCEILDMHYGSLYRHHFKYCIQSFQILRFGELQSLYIEYIISKQQLTKWDIIIRKEKDEWLMYCDKNNISTDCQGLMI